MPMRVAPPSLKNAQQNLEVSDVMPGCSSVITFKTVKG